MIDEIRVNGYRLLQNFSARLLRTNIVIGANASGKSTLLDLLSLIAQSLESSLKDVFGWRGGFSSVCSAGNASSQIDIQIDFHKAEGLRWQTIPVAPGQSLTYQFLISQDSYGQPVSPYEVLRNTTPSPGHSNPLKYLEATLDRCMIYDPSLRKLVPFDTIQPQGQQSLVVQAPSTASTMPMGPGESESVLRLSKMRFYNEYPVPSFIRQMLASMAFYPGFNIGRYSDLRNKPSEIRPETTLWQGGENLGTVLHELLTRHSFQIKADALKDFLRAAYPNFEDIFAETTFGAPAKVLVRVRETGMQRLMDLWELSDGFLRFLCLGCALLNPWPAPLIVIDEPEAGFHPRLIPIIADMLKSSAEESQLLVFTHNPDLVNRFSVEEIAVMSRHDSNASWVRPADIQELRILLEGPVTLGELHRTGELESAK